MKKNYPLPSVVVRNSTTTKTTKDNDSLISCLKIVVQGCPKLLSNKTRQQKTTILLIPT